MKKQFYILSFLLLNSLLVFGQKRAYKVILFGDSVGLVTVEKKTLADKTTSYHFESNAEAVLLFIKTKTFAKTDLIFNNGKLISGHVIRTKNNDSQELFYKWNGLKYDITDDDEKVVIDKKITYTTTNFFLEEPINIKEVFVERFNYFVPIEKLDNNEYLTKVDGGTNIYTYKNGKLINVKSTKGISINMEFIK